MTKKDKYNLKCLEAICKMIDHQSIPYTGITVWLQNVTCCDKGENTRGAVLISAEAYPRVDITYTNGKKVSNPIVLGN